MGTKKKKTTEEEPMEVDESPNQNGDVENGELDHISDDEEGGVRIGDIYIPPAPKPALTLDVTGPRLIITHIVNNNFKSYAGEQHLGPLHKCFTAIIGPNGSGKSNVIDSMLFVFGYRASKIRSKKISVLIHASSKHPNINSASVAVHFCQIIDGEDEEFTVVPNSEIVVTRTAFKDNSSTYTLNGRRVQFKEVARTLRAHGIDLDHNRFLILQGEVEQIAMMKPKGVTEHESGMLEYLEDIIGTSRYKDPIEKLNLKVEELIEMRKDKLNRVRLVEQEKQRLEQPMREAVELMNLTNIVLRTRNTLLQKYIYEVNKMVAEKNNELDGLKENLAKIDEKLEQLNNELKENNTVLKNGTQKYDALKVQKEEATEKLHTCKRKLVAVQSENTQATKKKKNLEQLLEQEKGKLIDLELVPEKNKREIKDCEKLLDKHKESHTQVQTELETAMAGVRSKTQGLKETKDKLEAKMVELKNISDEANNVYELAESELKIYLKREEEENEILRDMKQSFEKGENDYKEKTKLQKELEKSVPQNEKKVQEINRKLQALKDEETKVTREATALRTQVEQSKETMSANRSRGRVLDSLMRQKANGNLPGIFGRLGDLGGIHAKYDVAISTCCGALDNIVVDTVETAQACIEYLKNNNIGRGTMIALDKQEHLKKYYEGRRLKFPENVERLFDLIQVRDDRVRPAFYYALKDTLVANDLEQATRIAYGATRYRVVTLKGDVIETSGTMSGGGRTTMRGRMGSAVQEDTTEQDPAVMQQNEQRLAELDNRFQEIRNEQLNLDDTLHQISLTVNNGKMQVHQLNVELKSLAERIPVLKKQINQQEKKVASCKVDPKQKALLEKKLKVAEEKYNAANTNTEKVKEEISKVNEKISAVTGGQVQELQKNFDNLKKKITKISSEINKLNVAISTSERNAAKSKRAISQMESDLKETEKTLETLSVQKRELTLEIAQFEKQVEELEEKIEEGTEEFADLRKKISKMQKKEVAMKNERLDANTEVQKMEKTMQEMKSKIPMWQKELQSLKLEDPGIEGVPGIERPTPLVTHTDEELEEANVEELRHRLTAQKGRIGDGKPNVKAVQDYKEKEDLFLKRVADLDEITKKRNDMRQLYDQLKKKRTTDFLAGFNTITSKLKEMYQMITLGGDAELELVDSLDPFTEGIIFSVRPPNKSWKNISNLSGGEKTLSSLALVFALHYYKPSPLYVMDEIDAALDFKNVSIVANYIKERTKNAQFIIISLRYNMFEVSNRLVGIYKTEDCTQSVTIENKVVEDTPGEELATV